MLTTTNAGRNGQRLSSLQQTPTLDESRTGPTGHSRVWQQARGWRRNKERHDTSSRAVKPATSNNQDISSPSNDIPIVSISRDAVAGTEHHVADIRPRPRHRTKHAISKFAFSLIMGFCGRRGATEAEHTKPMEGPSIIQQAIHTPVESRLQIVQHSEALISTSTLYGEDDQDAEHTKSSREIERLQQDLSLCRSQIAELQKQHEAKPRDQVVPQGFFDITDMFSDSDVTRAVERLNAEVQQHATHMADCLVQDLEFKSIEMEITEGRISVMEKVSSHVGPALANALGSRPQEVPMLLQIAFQAYLAGALGQTASAWTIDVGHSSFIDSLYQQLRGVEAQATAGRWRSLARLHNTRDVLNYPESLIKRVATDLSNILLVAGCTAPQSDIQSKITSMFKERITSLIELGLRLNDMFYGVISGDFEVLLIQPGSRYVSHEMEETDGSQAGDQEGSVVLCTTHLGLTKWLPEGSMWEKGKKQKIMVIKAKVLLESLLDMEDY